MRTFNIIQMQIKRSNGLRIREVRTHFRKMSQSELASRVGVHRVTLARWEADKSDIPLSYAKKIADALDVTLDDIFCPNY